MIYLIMGFEIEFYSTENGKEPVADFIKSLSPKESAKIVRDLDLLQKFGYNLHYPYVDTIKGKKYKGLLGLRTKISSNIFRIFYFVVVCIDEEQQKYKAVLLHGIQKKSNKTPKIDLETALERMKDFISRGTK